MFLLNISKDNNGKILFFELFLYNCINPIQDGGVYSF